MARHLYRFLFHRLGRSLGATFFGKELRNFDEREVGIAQAQGILRSRTVERVPCTDPFCGGRNSMRVLPSSRREDGTVELLCRCGASRYATEDEYTAVEVIAAQLFRFLAHSNDMTWCFDRDRHAGGRVFPFARAKWLGGAIICLAAHLHRQFAAAEIAGAITLGDGPFVVLLPPGTEQVMIDTRALARHGIFVVRMDDVLDWRALEFDRARLLAATGSSSNLALPAPTPAGPDLVLDTERREATLAGARVKLTPLRFGFLLALARTPGRTVHRDAIVEIAYSLLNEGRVPDHEAVPHVGQVYKLKTDVVQSLGRAAERAGLRPESTESLIVAEKGIGYRLDTQRVRID